jgi:DNA-binding PadR family transcriptional regulator
LTPSSTPPPLKPHWFHILLALADKELHGYGIRSEVLDRTDSTVNLWPGVLYRSLKGLTDRGLIEDCAPPDSAPTDSRERHYYRITDTGEVALRSEASRMASYVEAARAKDVLPSHG